MLIKERTNMSYISLSAIIINVFKETDYERVQCYKVHYCLCFSIIAYYCV